MEEQGKRVMSCDRLTQYVHFFFPEIKLAAYKEDSCEGCFAIETELTDPTITDERRQELQELKATHINEAETQKRDASICERSSAAQRS